MLESEDRKRGRNVMPQNYNTKLGASNLEIR